MKIQHKITVLAMTALIGFPSVSGAASVIAVYNFTSGSAASSDTEANTTASGITFGSGISGAAFANNRLEIGGDNTLTTESGTNLSAQLGTAISNNGYATFTVTIPSSVTVSLTSLTFDYGTFDAYRFGIGTFTDKTGFTNGDQLSGRYVSSGNNSYPAETAGLTAAALQNLTNTTVEFRFYIGDGSASDSRTHFFDNISLSGVVSPVPEPGTTSLLAGFLTLLMFRRRR